MKIRSLHLEHFRKFTTPTSLSGFTDGVNVLAECNEFGKSTILAAIRGVLFERHSSRAQGVSSMQHWSNKTSPLIALEFELANEVYRIEKRFLHKEPYAKLTMPDGSIHQGDEAEEKLQQVLHFTRAGKTGSKPDDIGMWGALWVTQQDSTAQAELPTSAKQTIHSCLDREVGSLAGGTRGAALIAGVRKELATLQNGNGKPVGRYKDVLLQTEEADSKVTLLEAKAHSLANDITDLASLKRRISQGDMPGELVRTEEMLTDARSKKETAQRYEDQERHELATLDVVEGRLLAVQRDVEHRSKLQTAIAEADQRIRKAIDAEIVAAAMLEEKQEALDQQRNRVRIAREACDEAGVDLRRTHLLHDLAQQSQSLLLLQRRLELGESAQNRTNDLEASLLSFTVTEQGLLAVRTSASQLERTNAALDAQAARVTLDVLPEAATRIQVNGAALTASPITVIQDLIIILEGVGTISVQPGIKDRDSQLAKQVDEKRLLINALSVCGVTTIAEAEEQLGARQRCEQQLRDAKREIALHTPADPHLKLAAGIDALRNHVTVLRTALQAKLFSAKLDAAPEPRFAQELLAKAAAHDTELSNAAEITQALVPQLEEQQQTAVRMHAVAAAELEAAYKQHGELGREYTAALSHETDERLAARRSNEASAVLVQRGIVEEIKRTKPTDSVASMTARITRYEQAKHQISSGRVQMQQQVAILENRIEREEGIGIEEQLEEARRIQHDLDAESARFGREINVLQLLRDTLDKAEQAAKERYMAPVVARVTPYLQQLFPGAAIHCDENFHITGVVRELQQTERFDGLSDGTQEQIAVLTRLAFAEMLLDSGHPAMVILDDALAYSDDDRLERMFDLLTDAATRMQILILTCRGELFTRLGGNRVRALSSP